MLIENHNTFKLYELVIRCYIGYSLINIRRYKLLSICKSDTVVLHTLVRRRFQNVITLYF